MPYIGPKLFPVVKRAIALAENPDHAELLTQVRRQVPDKYDVTAILECSVVVDKTQVFIEVEFEYYTDLDRCAINTVLVPVS